MSSTGQEEFYTRLLDHIAISQDAVITANIGGDAWVFSNPETGRFVDTENVWDYFDSLRDDLGLAKAYIEVMGI